MPLRRAEKKMRVLLLGLAKSIYYKIVVTHQAEKNWMYDRTIVRPYKVLLLTCLVNCDRGDANTRLCSVVQWSVHWAPSQTTQVLVLAGARRCVLETCGKKKNASSAFRLG